MGFRKFLAEGRPLLSILMLIACARLGGAADPLLSNAPLAAPKSEISAGNVAATFAAAQRAQEFGLPNVAAGLYQQLLAAPGADRAALTLPLVTALLDAGRIDEADQVLNALQSPRGHDWHLRMALLAAQERRFDVALREVNRIDVDQLTRPDRAWFWFLRGLFADLQTPRNIADTDRFYTLAKNEATSDAARATILVAEERVHLRLATYKTADADAARLFYEQNQQRGINAYASAANYAVIRAAIGGTNEAVRFLSEILVRMPRAEREWNDQFRLLLGVIGDRARGGAGRNALEQLLANGANPDKQREALLLLAQASEQGQERVLFRTELDQLIRAKLASPILDGLLLMRAELALGDKDYATAERSANQLKDQFPGSTLRPNAFRVLTVSAWEQKRYRLAAENARQAREALAALPAATAPTEAKVVAQAVALLRVLEAEASFRAGQLSNSASDFRVAAEGYSAALQDPPAGISAGDLLFQRALAEIRSGVEDATKIVDNLAADSRFDAANRWEAEWSLARALNARGQSEEALGRVTRLLAAAAGPEITPALRARMSWLQARLSFDANHPELTLQLVPKLDAETAAVDPALRSEIMSTAALLKAEAEFRLGQETAALETMRKLRTEQPKAAAAVSSYLIEAAYYAEPGRDQIQKAQRALRELIDKPEYKNSEYVPYALFQLALLSERLGSEKDLQDANLHIEELVRPDRTPPAPPELVFAARLKQGDIKRTLNDFPLAQRDYEELVNNPKFAQRPDITLAQLRLAETHNALSSTDASGSHANIAQGLFEELLYRVSATVDVRVEAGYNLGKLLVRRGQIEKGRDVWWREVITPFLINAETPAPSGATRQFWLARTLLDLGELLEQRQDIDGARRVYVMLRDSNLGFDLPAIDHLKNLGVDSAKPNGTPAPTK
jgi:cellulose synthase operon protein C